MTAEGIYEATIGLEIHAELKTATKMFCSSKNDPNEGMPNANICPVCLAHPGTLPVINAEAVRQVLRVGVALGSKLADYSEFDRKNYFYPDLPKGYQISQFEFPLVAGGELYGVAITRIHLEEDTASSIHDEASGATLIDYNRSGVPLMELVTEPVIKSAEQAGAFARELQTLLRYLGASEANMEKGQMRVEANISVARKGERSTAYVEIKNLNSFRAMERAVAYEIKRQEGMLERGEKLIKQTLGWDENKQATFPQRSKEGSADYRYFPDPDLPSLKLSELPQYSRESLAKDLPELPSERRARYLKLGIKPDDADMYIRESILGGFFEAVIEGYEAEKKVQLASNYIANDLAKIIRDSVTRDKEIKDEIDSTTVPISVANFKSIIDMLSDNKISSRSAKDLLMIAISDPREPEKIAAEKGIFQVTSANDLGRIVQKIIADNPAVAGDYKAGKAVALEYLVGQGMKVLRGAADAATLRAMLKDQLD
jgi:aspartyl-tRNA(Asn)/glutamyl-tRNA(Gln) amidotransferase subunit B